VLTAPHAVKTPTASLVLPIPQKPLDDGWEMRQLALDQDTHTSPASWIQRQLFQYSPVEENPTDTTIILPREYTAQLTGRVSLEPPIGNTISKQRGVPSTDRPDQSCRY